jgi:chemotaxis protein methyltransferase CheR
MDDEQFRQLLDHFGYSWKGYRRVRKGVKRRISRHMQQLGYRSIEEYLKSLDSDWGLRRQLDSVMSVPVSRFFRDRALWKIMEEHIVPEIVKENREKVRFLSIGCACGEEVYSFKIVWDIVHARLGCMPELDLLATDINPDYLSRAQKGVYSKGSLKEVPRELRDTYFTYCRNDEHYRIAPSIKNGISWKVHDVIKEPFEGDFQIILLRNGILTYYSDELKGSAFREVVGSLADDGYLIIGAHEKLPVEQKELLPFRDQCYIFKRVVTVKPPRHEVTKMIV